MMLNLQQMAGEPIESESSTERDQVSSISMTGELHPAETWMFRDGEVLVARNAPVEYEGDNPVINPTAMAPGRPYTVLAYGQTIWAVKDSDGSVNFYGLPG